VNSSLSRWSVVTLMLVIMPLWWSCGGEEGGGVAPRTPVATVTVTPAIDTITTGATVQLTGTTAAADGASLVGRALAWSSSDDQIATVSNSGLVTGVAVGTATVTATSEGKSGAAKVIVEPVPFEPQEDTNLSGVQQFTTVAIPEGLTVTATDDLVLEVEGDVTVAGSLVGDCVAIEIMGGGMLTITGTVSNSCSDEGQPAIPTLTLVGNGSVVIDGAEISSGGDILIKNNPTLSEEDFASPTAAAKTGRARRARAAASRGSAQASACRIQNSSVSNRASGVGKKGADGTPAGGEGATGSSVTVFCDGTLTLRSDNINKLIAWSGGEGGAGTHESAVAAVAQGGQGGDGGTVRIGVGADLQINGIAPTLLQPGPGGDGGSATATGLASSAQSKGASATATGLRGGNAGIARITVGGEIVGLSILDIVISLAGKGGSASALAGSGRDAGEAQAGDGGDATATAGPGGLVPDNVIEAGAFISADITITPPARGFLAGAFGGGATAGGGFGGNGNRDFPNGGRGGNMMAQGGRGGSSLLLGSDGLPLVDGDLGGGATFQWGSGGAGWSDCVVGDIRPGGSGGAGGNASGGDGAGGSGKADGLPGGIFLLAGVGDGARGGDGVPLGTGGSGGADGMTVLGGRVSPGKVFQKGEDGQGCETPMDITVDVLSDPLGHDPFTLGSTMSLLTVVLGLDGTIEFTGPAPWVAAQGAVNPDGSFTTTGTGTIAGVTNVTLTFDGTLTKDDDGRVTGVTGGTLVWGANDELPADENGNAAPVSYTVVGTRKINPP
jgi:Big-like domain-containing protein